MDKYTYQLEFSITSGSEPSDARLYDVIKDTIDEGYDEGQLGSIVQLVSKVPVMREVKLSSDELQLLVRALGSERSALMWYEDTFGEVHAEDLGKAGRLRDKLKGVLNG